MARDHVHFIKADKVAGIAEAAEDLKKEIIQEIDVNDPEDESEADKIIEENSANVKAERVSRINMSKNSKPR